MIDKNLKDQIFNMTSEQLKLYFEHKKFQQEDVRQLQAKGKPDHESAEKFRIQKIIAMMDQQMNKNQSFEEQLDLKIQTRVGKSDDQQLPSSPLRQKEFVSVQSISFLQQQNENFKLKYGIEQSIVQNMPISKLLDQQSGVKTNSIEYSKTETFIPDLLNINQNIEYIQGETLKTPETYLIRQDSRQNSIELSNQIMESEKRISKINDEYLEPQLDEDLVQQINSKGKLQIQNLVSQAIPEQNEYENAEQIVLQQIEQLEKSLNQSQTSQSTKQFCQQQQFSFGVSFANSKQFGDNIQSQTSVKMEQMKKNLNKDENYNFDEKQFKKLEQDEDWFEDQIDQKYEMIQQSKNPQFNQQLYPNINKNLDILDQLDQGRGTPPQQMLESIDKIQALTNSNLSLISMEKIETFQEIQNSQIAQSKSEMIIKNNAQNNNSFLTYSLTTHFQNSQDMANSNISSKKQINLQKSQKIDEKSNNSYYSYKYKGNQINSELDKGYNTDESVDSRKSGSIKSNKPINDRKQVRDHIMCKTGFDIDVLNDKLNFYVQEICKTNVRNLRFRYDYDQEELINKVVNLIIDNVTLEEPPKNSFKKLNNIDTIENSEYVFMQDSQKHLENSKLSDISQNSSKFVRTLTQIDKVDQNKVNTLPVVKTQMIVSYDNYIGQLESYISEEEV